MLFSTNQQHIMLTLTHTYITVGHLTSTHHILRLPPPVPPLAVSFLLTKTALLCTVVSLTTSTPKSDCQYLAAPTCNVYLSGEASYLNPDYLSGCHDSGMQVDSREPASSCRCQSQQTAVLFNVRILRTFINKYGADS